MKNLLCTLFLLVFVNILLTGQSIDMNGVSYSRKELASFIDGTAESAMVLDNIAGLVIVVVKDGEVVFTNGYGYADYENQIKVDGEKTVFRVASITKLFTWTAVMQLFEKGLLDLDTDINEYLDFKIADTFSKPITMKHLMSHSAGFEDSYFGFTTNSVEKIPELEDWIKSHVVQRVSPPGKYSSYSNYGTVLASYIIQRISNIPYQQYVEDNILTPLTMEMTSIRQPYSPEILSHLAHGLNPYLDRIIKKSDFIYHCSFGAAELGTSGADMARFMIAHLNNGIYEDTRILKSETAKLMHSRLFGNDDRVNGIAYGFLEESSHNQRIISHDGNSYLSGHYSNLHLVPDENLGIFISTNSAKGYSFRYKFLNIFLDKYYPEEESNSLVSLEEENLQQYTGTYIMNPYWS